MSLAEPLRSRPFRLLWAGNTLNTFVENAQTVVVSASVLKLTDRPSDWGLVLAAEALVRAVLMPVGGMLADRFGARAVLVGAHAVRAAILASMVALLSSGAVTLPSLVAYGVIFGASRALFLPAANAAIPALVPPAGLQGANAAQALANTVVTFAAPLTTGVLVSRLPAAWIFLAGAFLCLTAAMLALAMPISPGAASARPGVVGDLSAGLSAVRRDPVIRLVISLAALASFGYAGAVVVGLPLLATFVLHSEEGVVGLLLGAVGAGALVGTVLSTLWKPARPGRAITWLLLGTALAVMLTSAAPSLPYLLAPLAAAGAGLAIMLILAVTLVQARTPPGLQGRVLSALMLGLFGLTPAAYLLGGYVGDWVGPRSLVLLFGGFMAAAALLGLGSRSLRAPSA